MAEFATKDVASAYSSTRRSGAGRHDTQYFEMFCNRGIYHQGWTAVSPQHTLGDGSSPLDEDVWELYDTTSDWSQSRDLARR